ncbi:lipocalin family protein [Flavobacterium sp. NRK F10]|uniref:lipocalin family protein n=1 Tax=Flavobacterium sp. NRK F10 TaxID=2954931 RepID=UPI0020904F02|nr:lipocalin family protein [Flavobacterium sp. NRK F10]MCO6175664.1 lipocalin family protein [Flavobacterium sp. NRK F10]
MKKIVLFLLVSLAVSCSGIEPKDIELLNGYWEIHKVEIPSGEKKEYKVNESVDYFEIADLKGFRKKLVPQMDGTFLTNEVQENITVEFKDDKVILHYKTNYASWDEEVISLTDKELVVKNQQDIKYFYTKKQF